MGGFDDHLTEQILKSRKQILPTHGSHPLEGQYQHTCPQDYLFLFFMFPFLDVRFLFHHEDKDAV